MFQNILECFICLECCRHPQNWLMSDPSDEYPNSLARYMVVTDDNLWMIWINIKGLPYKFTLPSQPASRARVRGPRIWTVNG